jgi:multicomponent Na+:H+ antiporter subunit A
MEVAVMSGFVASLAAPWLHKLARGITGWIIALLPLSIFLYFASFAGAIGAGVTFSFSRAWVPSLGVNLSFYLDGLSLLFVLLISGIGTLIVIYAGGYLAGHPQLGSFYGYVLMFMASMLGVSLANNLLSLFVFWELTSLSSYLLIGFDHEKEASRSAALKALLVTGGGGLAMLAGLVLLNQVSGATEISELVLHGEAVRSHQLYLPILLLILLGAFTKSAQAPFHFWLPAAMEAPTPVSAYLHSATMVKAGIYLLARMSPVLGGTIPWVTIVTLVGAVTMLVGAYLALYYSNLKRILAYTTISSLGTLVLLLGIGTSGAIKAAMVFLLAHALYKGAIVHDRWDGLPRDRHSRCGRAGRAAADDANHCSDCRARRSVPGRVWAGAEFYRKRALARSGPGSASILAAFHDYSYSCRGCKCRHGFRDRV